MNHHVVPTLITEQNDGSVSRVNAPKTFITSDRQFKTALGPFGGCPETFGHIADQPPADGFACLTVEDLATCQILHN